jgi:hypothetical protein
VVIKKEELMKRILIVLAVLVSFVSVAHSATYVIENDTFVSEIARKIGILDYFIYQMNPDLKAPLAKAGQKITYVSKGDIKEALAYCKKEFRSLQKQHKTETRGYATLRKEINELTFERICYYPAVDEEDNYEGVHWQVVLRQVEAHQKNQVATTKP